MQLRDEEDPAEKARESERARKAGKLRYQRQRGQKGKRKGSIQEATVPTCLLASKQDPPDGEPNLGTKGKSTKRPLSHPWITLAHTWPLL